MPNYQQGKIYKIIPTNTDDDICYVGSTTRPLLCQRMEQHRSHYKRLKAGVKVSNTSSYTLFDKYGVLNCSIELIEMFSCNTKDELSKKEGEYIRLLNCVNKQIPGRTKSGWYVDNRDTLLKYQKEHYVVNKETLLKYQKEHYVVNKETILEKHKEYYVANKETILEKHKEYYVANKSIIAEKRKKEYTCICGSTLQKNNKSQHERSHKHINYCASVSVVL